MERQVLAAVLLGLLIRGWRGFSMLDPFFFIPFACLSALLAGPIVLELRRREQSGQALRQVAKAVMRACGAVAVILAVALVALNYPWYETWLLPEWTTALNAILLSVASATGAAAATGLLMTWLPAVAVTWLWRALALTGLVVWRFAPGNWGNSTIVTIMDWGVSTTALCSAAGLALADAALLHFLLRRAGYINATAWSMRFRTRLSKCLNLSSRVWPRWNRT